ncbi:C39 family peptidase [Calidithermus roseus]|uniref:Peptidase C39-like domain-containing protein n=1 Tax=Calidithermus roseus TaxID=1644118 RepID=A0A399EY59_9DEIN|nr:C39 family peptidase [Calidithermus roseus]RIH87969.1 hypothetical protein Mrose_01036 [Calidithermus roseus]
MKYWFVGVLLLAALLGACTQDNTGGGSNSVIIKAAEGGVVEAGGARITIPPGVLSQDARVTLDVKAKPAEPQDNPMRPAGPLVGLDLGGASLKAAATLELPTDADTPEGNPVVLETLAKPESGEPRLWVHAATPVGAQASGLSSKLAYGVMRAGMYTAYVVPAPKPSEGGTQSLQVPFYYQAGLPWCTPTSLSMALNFHKPQPALVSNPKTPGGFASNYGLASLIKQPPNSGSGVGSILQAAGIPESTYSFMRWDAELIPSEGSSGNFTAFQAYAALATLLGRKPVWTSSDRQWHAFVITGVTKDGVYIADSNARPNTDWNGTHPSMSWKAFREANCTLKDPNDPTKGCADSGDAAKPDLYTLIFYNDPKPESERRGSIELSHGETIYFGGVGYPFPASLIFRNLSNRVISRWKWDGGYPNGHYFNDEATTLPTFPYGNNLVQDSEFRYLIYRSSRMEASFNVVNVTDVGLGFEVEARLYVGRSMKAQKFANVNVDAYNLEPVDLEFGNLAGVVGAVGGPTPARLELNLRQGGVLQDVKHIAFKLAPDPTDLPKVRILVPSSPTTLLKGEPFTFRGEGFDAHTLPDGRARLAWFEGGSHLGDGGAYTLTPNAAGSRTLTLVATGEYGLQAATSVSVSVIDPTRTPGEIVIVEPKNGAKYWSPDINQPLVDVPLVGYATYSNGAAVPGERLVWSAQAQGGGEVEVGRGSSLSVKLVGGRNYELPYTIRLTVLDDSGQAIGSKTVSITVGYTYVG